MERQQQQIALRAMRRRILFLAITLGSLTLLATGCGTLGYTSANADKANGKKLFSEKCGSCHTLADAGTTGTIGPNLDDAFVQDLAAGMTQDTIRQVVRGQIAYAITVTSTGSPGMPKNLVTGKDAADVAAYIASVAGQPVAAAAAPAPTPTPTPTPAPAPAPAPTTTTATPATGPGTAPSAATLALGKQTFLGSGCGACHTLKAAGSAGAIGPDLDNLAANAKTAGQPLAAYVRQSIVKPNAYIVPGFQPNVMPGTFAQSLTPPQLSALVAYLVAAASGK
jgi:mono/diheme cytochrome c family protein